MPLPESALLPGGAVFPGEEDAAEPASVDTFEIVPLPPESWLACELDLGGEFVRFGPDEADEGDLPSDIQWATQNPGGDSDGALTIRRPEWATREKLLFSPVKLYGPGYVSRYQGRVKEVSQVDLDSIRLDFEGMAAHLDDDEFFREIYIDRDLSRWGEPSTQRQIDIIDATISLSANVTIGSQDGGAAAPGVVMEFIDLTTSTHERGERWYYGNGVDIGELRYDFDTNGTVLATWVDLAQLGDDDVIGGGTDTGTDHNQTDATSQSLAATAAGRKYIRLCSSFEDNTVSGTIARYHNWLNLRVFGTHGLTKRGTQPNDGFYASDIIEHAVGRSAPMISIGPDSIESSTVIIGHSAFLEPTTVRNVIETVSAFGGASGDLPDWGVYDGEFFWRSPQSHGKTWRVRRDQVVVPNEDGPDTAARFAEVIVSYQDGSGTTKTVGPVGSGADTEDERLTDSNPDNPALRVANRRAHKDVGITFEEGAIVLGQAFLAEQNARIRRGTATIQGYATDDAGITEPACAIRACDRLVIEDENGTQPDVQPINSTSYSHDSLTLNANLGAAPHRVEIVLAQLAAAVERIGA